MTTTDLQNRLECARALLEGVDRNDPSAIFDCLVELEMLATDAIADYSVAKLLQARHRAAAPALGTFSTAA